MIAVPDWLAGWQVFMKRAGSRDDDVDPGAQCDCSLTIIALYWPPLFQETLET